MSESNKYKWSQKYRIVQKIKIYRQIFVNNLANMTAVVVVYIHISDKEGNLMSPYKNFLNAAKAFLESNGFLKFLLSTYIVVFAVGGGLFVLGSYFFGFFGYFLTCLGVILMLAGLLLTILKEDMMVLVIISGIIAVGSLGAWIYKMVAIGSFGLYGTAIGGLFADWFTPLFYFLAFGVIALLVFLKSEKFVKMRAESAARNQVAGIACLRCGGFIPLTASFCPTCGAPKPVVQAPPVQPPYASPVPPQYAPPVQPQYAPPVQQSESAPAESAAPKCVNCGADLAQGAIFCAKCGAKQ
jgi:hypothetical protein